ncbi:hypothetical protein D3C83_102760 [compost metagenome]
MLARGRTSIPGLSMGTRNTVIPRCLASSCEVRARRKHHCAIDAYDVHTFWPWMRHPSPSATAAVASEARSEPAFGSLNP